MIELARDLVQFHNASKVRREVLDVSPVKPLARFDEVQVVLLELAFLDGFLFSVFLAVLLRRID
jgi:hypothetical protein